MEAGGRFQNLKQFEERSSWCSVCFIGICRIWLQTLLTQPGGCAGTSLDYFTNCFASESCIFKKKMLFWYFHLLLINVCYLLCLIVSVISLFCPSTICVAANFQNLQKGKSLCWHRVTNERMVGLAFVLFHSYERCLQTIVCSMLLLLV